MAPYLRLVPDVSPSNTLYLTPLSAGDSVQHNAPHLLVASNTPTNPAVSGTTSEMGIVIKGLADAIISGHQTIQKNLKKQEHEALEQTLEESIESIVDEVNKVTKKEMESVGEGITSTLIGSLEDLSLKQDLTNSKFRDDLKEQINNLKSSICSKIETSHEQLRYGNVVATKKSI